MAQFPNIWKRLVAILPEDVGTSLVLIPLQGPIPSIAHNTAELVSCNRAHLQSWTSWRCVLLVLQEKLECLNRSSYHQF